MNTVGLCLEPLDILFFRDGRPFGAGIRAESGLAMPQTLAGAFRTALLERAGFDFEKLAAHLRNNRKNGRREAIQDALRASGAPASLVDVRVRGPFLARLNERRGIEDVLVPTPAILHESKGEATKPMLRLKPLNEREELPGWKQKLRPLWLRYRGATEAAQGYLTGAGQEVFLRGGIPEKVDVVRVETLLGHDHRTGIEILADPLTAKEGGIYGATFLSLRSDYVAPTDGDKEEREKRHFLATVLYAEIVFPDMPPAECAALNEATLPLGGEGRRVAVRTMPPWNWPHVKPTSAKQKPLLLLTTPGLFPKGRWLPDILTSKLVAAAVPGAVAVSGWDLARNGPKPNRFAAEAGSVYFLDSLPDNLPDALSDDPEDRAQGWGCYLKGVWTNE